MEFLSFLEEMPDLSTPVPNQSLYIPLHMRHDTVKTAASDSRGQHAVLHCLFLRQMQWASPFLPSCQIIIFKYIELCLVRKKTFKNFEFIFVHVIWCWWRYSTTELKKSCTFKVILDTLLLHIFICSFMYNLPLVLEIIFQCFTAGSWISYFPNPGISLFNLS